MARNPQQTLSAPTGMATAVDIAEIPLNRAREVIGFTPGRNGKLSLSKPLQEILETNDGNVVTGISYYLDPILPTQAQYDAGIYRQDKLVVAKCNGPNQPMSLYVHSIQFNASTLQMEFGTAVLAGVLNDVRTGGVDSNLNIRTVQYQNELFIVAGDGSIPMRLFMDDNDNPKLYNLGIVASTSAPILTDLLVAGNVNGTYLYYHTDADEKGRESSPSPSATITVANSQVEVQFPWSSDPQVVTKYIYRTTAGGSIGYRIATITDRSLTLFVDDALDSNITSNTQMPDIGSCEPPKRASAIELHKGRLMMNNRNIYDDVNDVRSLTQLQMSNLVDSINHGVTQFNLVPSNILDNSVLGLQMDVGQRNADEIVGLKSNGSILAIGTRAGFYHLYGDSIADWQIRYQHDVGLMSTDSLVEGDGMLFYLGSTGFKMTTFADGFEPRHLSQEIEDRFVGTVSIFEKHV